MRRYVIAATFLLCLAFAIPIEHKYDKLFRIFSLTLIPEGLSISPAYNKKIYFYISDLIALILPFMGLYFFQVKLKDFFAHPLWIIFFCAFFSILFSPFANYPVPYFRLLQLFTPLALFSFLSTAFKEEALHKLTRFIWMSLVIAGLFQTGIAITQYFHEAPLGLRILGESKEISTILVNDGSRWTIDHLFNISHSTIVKMRAAGTFPHANVLGGFLVICILSTYALIMQAGRGQWLLILTLPFQFFAMCLSFSRSAIFGWLIASLIWFGLLFYKQGFDKMLKFLSVLMTATALLSFSLLYHQVAKRGGIINYNAFVKGSDRVRIAHHNLGLKIMIKNPLFGVGYTQFSERAPEYFDQDTDPTVKSTAPHNIFLFLGCETGLISMSAFLFFIITLLYRAAKAPITLETATFIALFISFIFIGCCDFYPILFQQGKLMFFLLAGLLAAYVKPTPLSHLIAE
jgi:O-antigen ligase